jgi:replicative DNA helicase
MAKRTKTRDGIPDIAFEHGLPASIDAERSILGAILLDNMAFYEADIITSNDFALDSHQRIFHVVAGLMEDGHAVDIVTLAEEMRNRKMIDSVGGVSYLASLTEGLPRRLSIEEYVRIVRDKSQLRRTINVCSSAITLACDQSVVADELLTETDLRLLEITADSPNEPQGVAQASVEELSILEAEHLDKNPARHAVSCGVGNLDHMLGGGWNEGELSVLAGKPGQGKSSLLIQTMVKCGRAEIPAHVFQLEMTRGQVLRRMWSTMTGIPINRLMRKAPWLDEGEMAMIRAAQRESARFPLILDVNTALTKQQILSRARISRRRFGTRFVGLDYLQKIRFESEAEFRHIEVGDTAKLLATLAKNEGMAVLALSSLTEKSGRGEDTPPTLGDLRQSGDIQYEASTVVFVHRTHDDNKQLRPLGSLLVEKQRNGETGRVAILYNNCSNFELDPVVAATEAKQNRQAGLYDA